MSQPKGIIVKHTVDKMKAYVALSKNLEQINAGMVLTELLHDGIVHGLNTTMVHKLVAASLFDKYVEVAQGTPAVPGTDGRIEILVGAPEVAASPGAAAGAGGGVPEAPCDFVVVKAREIIARRVPPVPGVNGMDVFGNVLTAPPVSDVQLRGGSGTAVSSDDPNLLRAVCDGSFHRGRCGEMEVRRFMEISGDAGGDSENVKFDGDLRVTGSVMSDCTVDVSGSLTVLGDVENAAVRCGGDLTVYSSILGGEKTIIDCGGRVWASMIKNTVLVAGGDVLVGGDIVYADVTAGKGAVKAVGIVGGNIIAAGGVSAQKIGAAAGVRTVVDVGAMHGYIKRRENITNSINVQNLLSEGYASELFCYVRDIMDENGHVAEASRAAMDNLIKNLKDSVTVSGDLEKELVELDAMLGAVAECAIIAGEVYPNVLLKLGFSEQSVKEVMKDVNIRPAPAAKAGE